MAATRIVRAFLVGPTGVGKTDVAILVAKQLGAEILSVDSRQIYRDLNIGTAKPTVVQRHKVRHHLMDVLDPRERCSAGRFLELFRSALDDLEARGIQAIAVGGAGLYVDACLGRFHDLPPADQTRRAAYEELARVRGAAALHERLRVLDPETAARLAHRDLQRIVRALEVAESTGVPLSRRFQEPVGSVCDKATPIIYLTRPRRALYARIEQRCVAMVQAGLPEEVRRLLESGLPPHAPGFKSVGYSEWLAFAAGQLGREETMALFVRNSCRYAKRQETWFRNRHPARIEITIPADEPPDRTAQRVLVCLREGELPLDRGEVAT